MGANIEDMGKPVSGWVRFWRKIYRPLGFGKGYNFPLWIIFAGAMTGFVLARFQYLDINGAFKKGSGPGEWYYYREHFYKLGMTLHLGAVLPGGLLAGFQFLPVIRHKLILLHRINGYLYIILMTIGNVGALMIARRAFGGTLATQSLVGVLAILTSISIAMAYYNIKRLQIDQHRAWMLRSAFYFGIIITMRFIFIISSLILSAIGSYYGTMPCDKLEFMSRDGGENNFSERYPQCNTPNMTVDGETTVHGSFQSAEGVAVLFQMTFGMAGWIALFMHLVGVEIYLALTPAESERLRVKSYERQLEAGYENPGSAGLTVDRWGDAAPWQPPAQAVVMKGLNTVVSDNTPSDTQIADKSGGVA